MKRRSLGKQKRAPSPYTKYKKKEYDYPGNLQEKYPAKYRREVDPRIIVGRGSRYE